MSEPAPTPPEKSGPRFDRSDFISFAALFISIVGTLLGFRETTLLSQQQAVMQEEKSASVWPYLKAQKKFELNGDTLTATLTLLNKGIGPAIVGDLEYRFMDREASLLEIEDLIEKRWPETETLILYRVDAFEDIIAPGEENILYKIRVVGSGNGIQYLTFLQNQLSAKLCYCSVYGDCWQLGDSDRPLRTNTCGARLDL